jgi:hypothetical protein
MKTDIETLRKASWDKMEAQVVDRIRLLKAMAQNIVKNELSDQIANDLVLPALSLLGEFCETVKPDREVHPTCIWTHIGDSTDYYAGCSGKVAYYMPTDHVCGNWEYCVWCGRKIEFKEDDP